ncbi:MAG: nuclear transport factor 2 family protein [Mycobacterium sp.]
MAFYKALEQGDFDYCSTLFAEDAAIWHNYDQHEQSSETVLSELALVPARLRFEVVGRDVLADACIQRHIVHLCGVGGATAQFPAIQRIQLRDGLIQRIDEYLDPAAVEAAGRDVTDRRPSAQAF